MKNFRIPFFVPWIFPRRIWKLKTNNTVYLTFDDGPQNGLTEWILDFLKERKIQATFFCVGENVKNQPELFAKIISEGHKIGNHTMKHERGTKTNRSNYLNSIKNASEYIESNLFRPPYGRLPLWKTNEIYKNYKIVMWSWLSFDFDHSVPTEKILKSAKSIRSGDILVFHDNLKSQGRVKILLPKVVDILTNRGFDFGCID
ncbi:MAG: polysaccharide deacetylase family protein [Bacteroidota bacterium]